MIEVMDWIAATKGDVRGAGLPERMQAQLRHTSHPAEDFHRVVEARGMPIPRPDEVTISTTTSLQIGCQPGIDLPDDVSGVSLPMLGSIDDLGSRCIHVAPSQRQQFAASSRCAPRSVDQARPPGRCPDAADRSLPPWTTPDQPRYLVGRESPRQALRHPDRFHDRCLLQQPFFECVIGEREQLRPVFGNRCWPVQSAASVGGCLFPAQEPDYRVLMQIGDPGRSMQEVL